LPIWQSQKVAALIVASNHVGRSAVFAGIQAKMKALPLTAVLAAPVETVSNQKLTNPHAMGSSMNSWRLQKNYSEEVEMKTYNQMTRQELIEKADEWKKKHRCPCTVYQSSGGDAGLLWDEQQRLPKDTVWTYNND
jgi:hypothetical protein